ncbi:MAG: NAD(P)-binding protein [Halieaceae bacterium]
MNRRTLLNNQFFTGASWRSIGAIWFLASAFAAFASGVGVTERPEVAGGPVLTMLYYSLSLFVIGGVDLGTPVGGPAWARVLLWMSYFGAPMLAAWTLIEAFLRSFSPQSWQLRRLKNHIIVVSSSELSLTYLRMLREQDPRVQVVVVCKNCDQSTTDEIRESFNASVVVGDITHRFFLEQLRPHRAQRILLLGNDSLRSFEAASRILELVPEVGERLIVHCGRLRFMRAMAQTRVAQECQIFNSYHLAAAGLVQSHLMKHFRETKPKDAVILAGFGRFGQTIVEQLQENALDEMDTVVIIDNDAHRRVLVADEQMKFVGNYRRELFEGDISHPDVWDRVRATVNLDSDDTVVILGTGSEEENLRTALWIRNRSPRAKIIARCSKESLFAAEVGQQHDIVTISITELVEQNIPRDWIALD